MNSRDMEAIQQAETDSRTALEADALDQALQDTEKFSPDERRKIRIDNCGKVVPGINPHTGKWYWRPQFCGCYRECEKCAKRRGSELKRQVKDYSVAWELRMIELPEHDAKEFCSELGSKETYRKLPQSNGNVLVLFEDMPDRNQGKLLTPEEIDSIDWTEITTTPEKKRCTGSLAKPGEKPSHGETANIYYERPASNAPLKEQIKASEIAEQNTQHLQPKTAEEVELAIQERVEEYKSILISWGYDILYLIPQTVTVKIKRIKWLKQYESQPDFPIDSIERAKPPI